MSGTPESQTQTQETQSPLDILVFSLIRAKSRKKEAEKETEKLLAKAYEYVNKKLNELQANGFNVLEELECKIESLLDVMCEAIIEVDDKIFNEVNDNIIDGTWTVDSVTYSARARIHRIYNMDVPASKIYFNVWRNVKYFEIDRQKESDDEEEYEDEEEEE